MPRECLYTVMICTAGLTGFAAGSSAEARIPVGLDNLPRAGNAQDATLATRLGLGIMCDMAQWREPSPDNYVWNLPPDDPSYPPGLDAKHLRDLKRQGYRVAVTLTHVHMDEKHLPAYLADKAFDDPYVLDRLEQWLVCFLERYGDSVDVLNMGNEVNNYFGSHPEKWSAYVAHVKRASEVVHRVKPSIKVGVVLLPGTAGDYWDDIEAFCDVFAFTYYAPNTALGETSTAQVVNAEDDAYLVHVLDEAIRQAGRKPVLITEMGCATHPAIGSSPEIQTEFIRHLFRWLEGKEDRILGITWISLTDWPYNGVKEAFKDSPNQEFWGNERVLRFLTSLGLKYGDGSPKPGYAAFTTELQRYQGAGTE